MQEISWDVVYQIFQRIYPKLGKMVECFQPAGYMSILLYLTDGSKAYYDDSQRRVKFLKERWK